MKLKKMRLTKEEKEIEKALLNNEYVDVSDKEFEQIAQAVARRKKDAVLNIRISSYDLLHLKMQAKKMGIKYQTFVSEILHTVARR